MHKKTSQLQTYCQAEHNTTDLIHKFLSVYICAQTFSLNLGDRLKLPGQQGLIKFGQFIAVLER